MRIVNSARLWDNRRFRGRRFPKALFVGAVLVGLALAGGVITLLQLYEPEANLVKGETNSPQVAAKISIPDTHVLSTFSPPQDNLDDALNQKLFPLPPKPNCDQVACLALTFDDGPDPVSTPIILDALRANNVKATFFVVGVYVVKHPALVARIAIEGNEIGNHSWVHADFTKLTREQMTQQINDTQNAVVAAGAPVPTTFRPPYERINDQVKSQVQLPIILWNVDPRDWKQEDPNLLTQMVVSQAKPGGIIILHDMHPVTATAIGGIIQNLASRFQLVTVSELLNLNAESRGVFFGR